MTRPSLLLSLVRASESLQQAHEAAFASGHVELAEQIRQSGIEVSGHIGRLVKAERRGPENNTETNS